MSCAVFAWSVFCSLTSKINISVKFWDILLKFSPLFLILHVVYAQKISEKSEGVWWTIAIFLVDLTWNDPPVIAFQTNNWISGFRLTSLIKSGQNFFVGLVDKILSGENDCNSLDENIVVSKILDWHVFSMLNRNVSNVEFNGSTWDFSEYILCHVPEIIPEWFVRKHNLAT